MSSGSPAMLLLTPHPAAIHLLLPLNLPPPDPA
jgi:hypothetical protein